MAACSGIHSPIPPAGESSTPTPAHRASVTLRIHVPKRDVHRHGKGPTFVSPATKGMTVLITGPATINEVMALTPGSTGCTTNLAGVTCAQTVVLPPCTTPSCYLATIATYDAVSCSLQCTIPPGAHELSAAQNVPFIVSPGKKNAINLVLGGYPVSVQATPLHPGYLQGDAHRLQLWGLSAQKVAILALDADANAIVGRGSPTISATSGNTAQLKSTGPTSAAPNTVVLSAQSTGSPPVVTPGSVNLSLTITPPANSGASPLKLSIPVAIAHSALYVATFGAIDVYYDGNTGSAPNLSLIDPKRFGNVRQITVDPNGTLYVVDSLKGGAVFEYPPGANGSFVQPSLSVIGGATNMIEPWGVAVGAQSRLYVTNNGNNTVTEYAPSLASSSSSSSSSSFAPIATIVGAGTGLSTPECAALDANETLYVANPNGAVTEYPKGANGDATPTVISGSGPNFDTPMCVAIDSAGVLYVSDGTPQITTFAPGASGNATPLTRITSSSMPPILSALAVDAAGTIYTGGTKSSTVTEYAAGANGNVAPIATITLSGPGSSSSSSSSTPTVAGLYAIPAPNLTLVTP